MMAEKFNINHESVHTILLEELHIHKVCAKIVPKLLSDDQKQHRVQVCEDMLERIGADSISLGASSLETNLECFSTTQIHHDPRKQESAHDKV